MDNYTVPVERIANLLDDVRPGWFRQIDLGKLAMEDCSNCLLGQLFGQYGKGLTALGLDYKDGVTYGVEIPDQYAGQGATDDALEALAEAEYSKLEDAIRDAVNSRLNFEREVDSMLTERRAVELETTYA